MADQDIYGRNRFDENGVYIAPMDRGPINNETNFDQKQKNSNSQNAGSQLFNFLSEGTPESGVALKSSLKKGNSKIGKKEIMDALGPEVYAQYKKLIDNVDYLENVGSKIIIHLTTKDVRIPSDSKWIKELIIKDGATVDFSALDARNETKVNVKNGYQLIYPSMNGKISFTGFLANPGALVPNFGIGSIQYSMKFSYWGNADGKTGVFILKTETIKDTNERAFYYGGK